MELTHFRGFELPSADEDVVFPFEARANAIELPNGSFDPSGNELVLRPFVITRNFKITDVLNRPHKIGEKTDQLMQALYGGRGILRATWRDGSQRQTFAKVVNAPRPRRSNDRTYQEITVAWYIDYPYWLAREDEPIYFDNGEHFDAGKHFDGHYESVTINALQKTFTIANTGMVPFVRGTLVITPAAAASITNLTITNKTNWMKLDYVGTIAYPDFLVIDFLSKSVKKSAVNNYSALRIPTGQMEFMRLEQGNNDIQLDVVSRTGNTAFEWHWARHYL